MRNLARAALLGVIFLLASPATGQARVPRHGAGSRDAGRQPSAASLMTLSVSAGYQNIYRGTAWTPVRVTLHNGTSADAHGTLEIPQSEQSASAGASAAFHGLYQAQVTLPAGGTKHVTLYVPGSGVQGQVSVRFEQGNRTLATGTAYPMGVDYSALLIGVMASNPGDAGWIAPAIQRDVTTHVVPLSTASLDPLYQALATFDIIVLTNVDTSQLDRAQLSALESYVQNGGSLLLVGGTTWQETLRPLPSTLLPGHLTGMRIVSDLHSLLPLGSLPPPAGRQTAAVSVLSQPSGTVLASQTGVPLVVRKTEGQGVIEYLAFDPSLDPVQHWRGAPRLLEHLVAMAAPLAISRTWSPQGFRGRFRAVFNSLALTNELSNLPSATVPLLAIFAVLTVIYVLLLGPANFLLLRWMGRQHLAWITIPTLAVTFLGSAYGITTHLRGSSVQLNSVGMVTLNGQAGSYPATFYLGLVAPLPGDYHLTYQGAALPVAVPDLSHPGGFFWRNATTLQSSPLGLRLQEGSPTEMTYLAMKRWSIRDVTLNTTVHIPGAVQSNLGVDAQGNIAGSIHNGTNLDLLDPVLVAGQSVTHLPQISAGATVRTRVQPGSDFASQDSSLWSQLYGGTGLGEFDGFGGFRGCCDQFSLPRETTLLDRLRNAVSVLSQLQSLSPLGNVLLIGWSQRPLGTFTDDGSIPQRRDLTLVVTPLSVHLPAHGSFRLRVGTLGAQLVDILPRASQSNSFGFFNQNSQQVSVGPGGALTFEFNLPGAGHVRFRQLAVAVNFADGGTSAGRVYDWHTQRWVTIDLSNGSSPLSDPNRFVSPQGHIMVKLQATSSSGDVSINDPYHDVQISGAGAAT